MSYFFTQGERMAASLPLPKTSSSPSRTPQGTPQVYHIQKILHPINMPEHIHGKMDTDTVLKRYPADSVKNPA